jgi:hypothetical protein
MIESIVTLLMQALGLVFLVACLIVTAALVGGLVWLAIAFPLAALCLLVLFLLIRN